MFLQKEKEKENHISKTMHVQDPMLERRITYSWNCGS